MRLSFFRALAYVSCVTFLPAYDPKSVLAAPPESGLVDVTVEDLNAATSRRSVAPEHETPIRIAKRSIQAIPPNKVDLKSVDKIESTPTRQLDYTGRPMEPLQLTETVRQLKPSLERTLRHYFQDTEVARGRSNWGMMHAVLVFGKDTQVIANNRRYSTIAWVAGNNICRGQRFFDEDSHGIKVKDGPGLQGHQGQFLMVCGLTGVPSRYPLYVNGNKYTIEDLIRREQADCRTGEELTFAFTGLIHYLDTDATWTSSDGQRWDFERLIAEELSQPVIGAACGGTHRLMILSHALRIRRAEGKPITGQWARAQQFLDDFVQYALTLQNRDGSWSTNWFAGRGDNGSIDRKIQTTGHIVEWLLTTLPNTQLQDPSLVRGVSFINSAMYQGRDHEWSIGPKGHANRALRLFYERVYRSGSAW
ncbi:hypothetical protein [Crateriforma conspicua]|uniref:Prenyltransferase and squalene oxidase repeat protein n=1 Tax=Crateriforma conspicua TaxID=2527996 RepID=A0A5C6FQR9_9PLAN|nr:hypothetical protein [Crateriforma conspicua]TWU64586.1 hypothetical protein V7x_01300 [Crateriforma conspicua]